MALGQAGWRDPALNRRRAGSLFFWQSLMPGCAAGLDVFLEAVPARFRGARVGLIANPASVDGSLVHASARFAQSRELRLAALFGPQHGARADVQDNMIESPDEVDARLGVPVYSLYGVRRQPAAEALAGLDVLVCDLPDVGSRPYTFLWTMLLAMEACTRAGLAFVVLDRPNPIGGLAVEGGSLNPGFASFIGLHPLPMRHGMTMGELATLFRRERRIDVDLTVAPCRGLARGDWFDQTGLPWVMASPNMPALDTATVYPGTVLLEGTNLSEGRGTTRPFEIFGAPYLDADRFAERLNHFGIAGARFRPAWFRPTFDKWTGVLCGGAQLHVLDRLAFQPCLAGVAVLRSAMELGGREFAWRQPPFEYVEDQLPIDLLSGSERLRLQLDAGLEPREIARSWAPELEAFLERREALLLY